MDRDETYINHWQVAVAPGGWLRLWDPFAVDDVVTYLRYRVTEHAAGPRLDLESLVMQSGPYGPLSGRAVRSLPFTELEDRLNTFLFGAAPVSARAKAEAARREFLRTGDTVPDPTGSLSAYFGDGPTSLDRAFADAADWQTAGPADQPPPVAAPQGRITDEFLRDVATAYRWYAARGESPAKGIAEISGAPVRTVHRWVLNARGKGFLPPARAGRAG